MRTFLGEKFETRYAAGSDWLCVLTHLAPQMTPLLSTPEEEHTHTHITVYQKVRRWAQKLCIVEKKKDSPLSGMNVGTSTVTTLSSLTRISRQENSSVRSVGTTYSSSNNSSNTTHSPLPNRRLVESLETPQSTPKKAMKKSQKSPAKAKKMRRTSKQVQRDDAVVAIAKQKQKMAMKTATKLIRASKLLPNGHKEKKTIAQIVKETNKRFTSNLSANTVGRYVWDGMIGISPMKRGPVGDFTKGQYEAMKGAYVTYLKLEQATARNQSTTKEMSKLVNACVNQAGFTKMREDLARKVKKDTADQFVGGKSNVIEQRRIVWTTKYNLEVWFDTWKGVLIELGFVREKGPNQIARGEVVFFDGQERRILNIDETDGSIDETTGVRGGRPAMTFLVPDVTGYCHKQKWVLMHYHLWIKFCRRALSSPLSVEVPS
jgi:hypothetical protein